MTDEKNEIPRVQPTSEKLPINKETLDIIVANIIPSSKYFETRFDYLEHRVIRIEEEVKVFRTDMDRRLDGMNRDADRRFDEMKEDTANRFEQVDRRLDEMKEDNYRRFEQVDKRFEQVDKRFEQVDKRFEQMIQSIDRLSDNLQDRDKDQRGFTMRMFSISIVISFVGVLGVALKLFGV
ncbi:MAG: hypothetical protein J7K75_12340 [Desulfuromonas sp.]|nr:hypothetical protein [Desulfuromonas sp.]